MSQVIGWFSAGVTSAVAIKVAIDSGLKVIPIYFETGAAHEDNVRFIADCERWYGTQIITVQNKKYKDIFAVFDKHKHINGPYGADCTNLLKKEPRIALEKWIPYDSQVFGFEFSPREVARAKRFNEQYPESKAIFPLIEQEITKARALGMLEADGIKKPFLYSLGFHNNNCIPCVKSGMGAMNMMRKHFPAQFQKLAEQERKNNRTAIKGIFLDELDPERGNYPEEITPECGVVCPVEEEQI